MIFKNNFKHLLNEAEEDDNTEETPEEQSTEETPEEVEEETPDIEDNQEEELSDEDQEFVDSDDGSEVLDSEDESSENEDNQEEEEEVKGNPYAKKIYFKRLENLDNLISRFLDMIKEQEVYYKNNDKTEKRNKNIVNHVNEELFKCRNQIKYLLEEGVIISLDINIIQTIYAKMKTKVDTCLKLYSKVMDVKL